MSETITMELTPREAALIYTLMRRVNRIYGTYCAEADAILQELNRPGIYELHMMHACGLQDHNLQPLRSITTADTN